MYRGGFARILWGISGFGSPPGGRCVRVGQETREKNRCQLTSANGGQLRHVRLGCDKAIGVGNSQEQF